MNLTEILVGIIVLLGGAFIFVKSRKDNAEALITNQETKEKLLNIDKEINKIDVSLALEEAERKALEERLKKEQEDVSKEDLTDFFNNRNNK